MRVRAFMRDVVRESAFFRFYDSTFYALLVRNIIVSPRRRRRRRTHILNSISHVCRVGIYDDAFIYVYISRNVWWGVSLVEIMVRN